MCDTGTNGEGGMDQGGLQRVSFQDCKAACDDEPTCVGIAYYGEVGRKWDNILTDGVSLCRRHTSANNCCDTVGVTTGCATSTYAWGYYKKG